jgi:predicted transcriptional regulator
MERLQGASWVKAFTLPSSPTVIDRLLNKGWIEKDRIEGRLCYRMTDQGLAAKKMRV